MDRNLVRHEIKTDPTGIPGQLAEASKSHVAMDLQPKYSILTRKLDDFPLFQQKKATKEIRDDSTHIDDAQNDAEILPHTQTPTNPTRILRRRTPPAKTNTFHQMPQFMLNQQLGLDCGIKQARENSIRGPAPSFQASQQRLQHTGKPTKPRAYKQTPQTPQLTGQPSEPPANKQTRQRNRLTGEPSKPPSSNWSQLTWQTSEPPANKQTRQRNQLTGEPSEPPAYNWFQPTWKSSNLTGYQQTQQVSKLSQNPSEPPAKNYQLSHQWPQLTGPPSNSQKPKNGPYYSVAGGFNNPNAVGISSDITPPQILETNVVNSKTVGEGAGESQQQINFLVAESLNDELSRSEMNNINELGASSIAPAVPVQGSSQLSPGYGNTVLNQTPAPLVQNQLSQTSPNSRWTRQQSYSPRSQRSRPREFRSRSQMNAHSPQSQQPARETPYPDRLRRWPTMTQFATSTFYIQNELLYTDAAPNGALQRSSSVRHYGNTVLNQIFSPPIQRRPSQISLGSRFADRNPNSPHRQRDLHRPPHFHSQQTDIDRNPNSPHRQRDPHRPPHLHSQQTDIALLRQMFPAPKQRMPYAQFLTVQQPPHSQISRQRNAPRSYHSGTQLRAENRSRFVQQNQQQQQYGIAAMNAASQSRYQADFQFPHDPPSPRFIASTYADQLRQQQNGSSNRIPEQNVQLPITRPRGQRPQARADYDSLSFHLDMPSETDGDDQRANPINFYSMVPH